MGVVMEKLPIPTSLPTKLQEKMEEAFCDKFTRERERGKRIFFFPQNFCKVFLITFPLFFYFPLNFLSILP